MFFCVKHIHSERNEIDKRMLKKDNCRPFFLKGDAHSPEYKMRFGKDSMSCMPEMDKKHYSRDEAKLPHEEKVEIHQTLYNSHKQKIATHK